MNFKKYTTMPQYFVSFVQSHKGATLLEKAFLGVAFCKHQFGITKANDCRIVSGWVYDRIETRLCNKSHGLNMSIKTFDEYREYREYIRTMS